MNTKKRILLKLTGEVFTGTANTLCPSYLHDTIKQIKQLENTHLFAIVIGGGNFFRGNIQGTQLGLSASAGHQAGMLATMLNAIIAKDLFEQSQITSTVLCAVDCPSVGTIICPQSISSALADSHVIIFTGGTGNPFFTTDTNAVLRALQIDAHEVWKGTKVNGVYNKDPKKHADAQLIKHISYDKAITEQLGIMDATALTLAKEHQIVMRVFNIFEKNSLIKAAQDTHFGSRLSSE